jgi:outer membrane protein OmpA-like peptidoglycan-associated protein
MALDSARLGMLVAAIAISAAARLEAQASPPQIPIRAGVTVVSAVLGDDQRHDYEQLVSIVGATGGELTLRTFAEDEERSGRRRQVSVTRRVSSGDIASAPVHVLGFYTGDSVSLPGTTSLGPSLDVVRSLRTTGRATYSVKNYAIRQASTGTISLIEKTTVPFPVLLNGRRVTVPALHAAGQLRHPQGVRPWEIYVLDHPVQPILLKVAYGAPNAAIPAVPEWSRQVIRIDTPEDSKALENALATTCRVELPGVYFEFNSASLNPQSEPALRSLGELLGRRPEWRISIEGHTDSVGTDGYNMDLSARRAAAVREALVSTYRTAPGRLTTAGFGESRPREPNATPEGRARNRRVELVRAC